RVRKILPSVCLVIAGAMACSSRVATPRDTGSPTPAAGPAPGPGTTGTPEATPASEGTGGLPQSRAVPLRPDQAPLVHVNDVLEGDSLLGRRVRVAGRCTAAGSGRRAGSWTLEESGSTIEVRGLVPSSCGTESTQTITIFAQVEPSAPGSTERLLLRLPD
ncbi:MAG TPA: hypothetical protein VIG95_11080, partial [Gemmatimonadales bacterium]